MDKESDSEFDGIQYGPSDPKFHKLVVTAQTEGYVVRNVPSNGNCMFHAVVDQMKLIVMKWKGDHSYLRRRVVQYLHRHARNEITEEHLSTFIAQNNWNDYLQDQSLDGTYGDHLTLMVLSNILERKIIVLSYEGTKTIILGPGVVGSVACKTPIVLGHIPEKRYVSLWSPDNCPESQGNHVRYLPDSSSDEGKEDTDGDQKITLMPDSMIKGVGHRELTGDLQKRTVLVTFNEMFKHLSQVKYQLGTQTLMERLNNMFNHLRISSGDLETVSVAYGCLVSFYLGGNLDQCLNILKHIDKSLPKYNIKESNIVSTVINYRLYQFYTYKARYGKAWKCLQKALVNIQEDAPSSWTAQVYFFRAQMYDRYSQLTPKSRSRYQEQAIKNLILARESFLCENSHKDVNYLFQPILCTLYIVCITLDMPTIETINTFNKIHLTLQCGSSVNIKQEDVKKADSILCSITVEQMQTQQNMYQLDIDEKILIISMFVTIRQSQLHIHHSNYCLALKTLKQMWDAYSLWEIKYKDYDRAVFNISPILNEDIKSLHEKLLHDVITRCPPHLLRFYSMSHILAIESVNSMAEAPASSDVTEECEDFSDQCQSNSEYLSSD